MTKMPVSSIALLLLLLLDLNGVSGNFFSRIIKIGRGEDSADKPAPSGATNAMGSEAQVGSIVVFVDGVPLVHLANSNKVPLVGLGVGNMQHEIIPLMVAEALQPDKRIRLIDTAHASKNEHLVAEGINKGVEKLNLGDHDKVEVHVVTKVWYTHLGYERTKKSVEESLSALQPVLDNGNVDLKIHLLLHWPRCFDNIPWMNCEGEEADLPEDIKNSGPDPTKDPEAWKESWVLLEDMYLSDKYPIASIGVSNFHVHDIEMMEAFARIHPHILQVNLWSLLYDAELVEYCHKHRIHMQVYNAMAGTISKPEIAPRAYHHIQKVANEISDEIDYSMTPAQVILAWLIQHGVSVIPRTSRLQRLDENSAVALASIPAFTDLQVETVAHAVEAYMSGNDLEHDIHVSVSFHAVSQGIMLYWRNTKGVETRITHIPEGETFTDTTYPNHVFRTYLASNKDVYRDHKVTANYGEHTDIHVEL